MQLDVDDHEKLQMLETYMQSLGETVEPAAAAALPSRAEDVDKFMAELAAVASGGADPERKRVETA